MTQPIPYQRKAILWMLAAVAVLLAVGVSSCAYWLFGAGQRPTVAEYPDAVQVIARPGEAWLFLDIEKYIRAPGAIAGAPRTWVIRQHAVVFDERGVKQQIPITVGKTTTQTFNRNLAVVFGLDDGLYRLDRPSLLCRWTADHFEPMRQWSRETFAKVPALAAAPHYQEDEALDAASARHGWTPVLRDSLDNDTVSFDWAGGRYVLDTEQTTTPSKVRLRRVDPGQEWSADVAAYNDRPRRAQVGE